MTLRVAWTKRAKRQGDRLEPETFKRILRKIRRFAETGHGDVVKMRGTDSDEWRLRVGDYRVRFRLSGGTLQVLHVGHRSDVYRR